MTITKNIIKSGLVATHALSLINKLTQKHVAILRYHSIQDDPDFLDSAVGAHITHATEGFRQQMELIASRYKIVSMDDLLTFLNGETDLDERSVVVTFDDGFKDNIDLAIPILNHYGIPATFYLTVQVIDNRQVPFFIRIRHAIWTTGKKAYYEPIDGEIVNLDSRDKRVCALQFASKKCSRLAGSALEDTVREIEKELDVEPFEHESNFMMSWDDVVQLHRNGHIIGSHTLTHPNIAHIDPESQEREIFDSKRILESKIKAPVIHFSYPNHGLTPQWNKDTNRFLGQAGYKTAVISAAGSITHESDPFRLNRVYVPSNKKEFLWYLDWALIGRAL